ncbi:MAG: hypothetical protein IPL96_16785 [Holophagaceae bacterium]|nr:hypothetical protein [Holophagaceae bacterium]
MEVAYCRICHSDIHQVRNEGGNAPPPDGAGPRDRGRITAVGPRWRSSRSATRAGVGVSSQPPHYHALRPNPGAVLRKGRRLLLQQHGRWTGRRLAWRLRLRLHVGRGLRPEALPCSTSPVPRPALRRHHLLRPCATGRWARAPRSAWWASGALGHGGVKLAAAMGAEVTC